MLSIVAKKTDPIFELTNLLFTGKTSPSMRDFLGGSGKLSERARRYSLPWTLCTLIGCSLVGYGSVGECG